ncbi:MAG TPA: YdcF family protein [Candidatus Bathyarchaeia archaeon]|nr:YdcF family protein [Candidatus Bathyarchaeia archaeon]
MKTRNHYSQVPNAGILRKILKKEQGRPIPEVKQNLHFVDFKLLELWLKAVNIKDDFLKQADWQVMLDQGRKLQPEVIKETFKLVSKNDFYLLKILKNIEKYLGRQDEKEKVDIIFVFGSKDMGRITKAVSLWQQDLAGKILITGGARFDERETKQPEAIIFKKEALKLGVPEKDLIIEPKSITIADNVRSGLNLLDKRKIKYKSIMTMVAWFAQRRAWSHLIKYVPEKTVIVRVNSDMKNELLMPGQWYQNEIGLNVVFSEFLKMKMGVILDTN